VLFLPKWLTQGGMDCCIKIVINLSYLTIASVHSLRSLGQLYGRISLRSKAAPINLPSMRGVSKLHIAQWIGRNLFLLIGGVVLIPVSAFVTVMTLAFGVGFAPQDQSFYGLYFLGAYILVFPFCMFMAIKRFRIQNDYGYWDVWPIFYFAFSFIIALVN
jgi:hypothetical protein